MKFGQDVYWGDGGWRAQIMGVMGGKRVAELGVLGEHGRCDGGRREVAGRACPAPTGWRKGSGCWPEGARVWGGFGPSL